MAVPRTAVQHQGRTVYEWDQSVDEVNIYIKPPPGLKARDFEVKIEVQRLQVGIKGSPPYLNEATYGKVKPSGSFWTLEDGEMHIALQKQVRAEHWPSALQGHQPLNPAAQEEVRRRLMLERFQAEHPGFDFSGAEFTGAVPDPSQFMGGMR